MCIISFYKIKDQILLTHSRDESVFRKSSLEIEERIWANEKYFAPIDQEKQGTWIFYSQKFVACILNGGKTKPNFFRDKYKKSRGIVLLDLMKYNSVEEYIEKENFEGIAPFTIFVYERITEKIFLLFWDENTLEVKDLSSYNFVFRCSSTLYSLDKMLEIEKKFPTFNIIRVNEIYALHDSLKMKDGEIEKGKATTSITQIFINKTDINMKYCPLS